MEDLIGFLIFVFYIISRVKKDRSRGMNREPSQNTPLPDQEYAWEPSYEPEPQREIEYWEEPEPAYPYGEQTEQRSLLDSYESMEGVGSEGTPEVVSVEPAERNRELLSLQIREEKTADMLMKSPMSAAAVNLQQAVIWSEILQKPKALQRRGAFGHRY